MKTFKDYFEAKEAVYNEAPIKVGDKVRACGITSTIKEIYYSDIYSEVGHPYFKEAKDEDLYYIFYDIEFRDTNGTLRHWKSSFDGGQLIRA